MAPNFDAKIAELFIDLPEPAALRGGAAVPVVHTGKLLFVGGVLPFLEGRIFAKGRVGLEVSLDQAVLAAKNCVINALAVIRQELGGTLNKVRRIVQLSGFVASGPGFTEHYRVLDGAGELLTSIFGASGKHTRIVSGTTTLPHNACLELSLIVEVQ